MCNSSDLSGCETSNFEIKFLKNAVRTRKNIIKIDVTDRSSKFDTLLDQMNRTCVFGSFNSIEKLYFQYQMR